MHEHVDGFVSISETAAKSELIMHHPTRLHRSAAAEEDWVGGLKSARHYYWGPYLKYPPLART